MTTLLPHCMVLGRLFSILDCTDGDIMKFRFEEPVLSFPERLLQERKKLSLSQEEFGRLGGVSEDMVTLFESGQNWPSTEFIENLRKHGVDVGFIASGIKIPEKYIDWALLEPAFRLMHRHFIARKDLVFSEDQLFDVLNTTLEAAMNVESAPSSD